MVSLTDEGYSKFFYLYIFSIFMLFFPQGSKQGEVVCCCVCVSAAATTLRRVLLGVPSLPATTHSRAPRTRPLLLALCTISLLARMAPHADAPPLKNRTLKTLCPVFTLRPRVMRSSRRRCSSHTPTSTTPPHRMHVTLHTPYWLHNVHLADNANGS